MEQFDILMVEDDEQIAELYKGIMEIMPYTCKVVTSGEEAIELLSLYRFKICVLDIRLEGQLNGVELSIKIKSAYPETKLYAMTGFSRIFDNFDPNIAGFEDVLQKPKDFRKLFKIIEEELSDK